MIIVTGGAGFIGSNLCQSLTQGGADVAVVDDLTDGHKFVNLHDSKLSDYFDLDEFRTRIAADDFGDSIDAIFHQGACSTTTEWDGKYMLDNNFTYSKALLHYCQHKSIPFIYASSAAVYGASQQFSEYPANERPLNVYGYSKLLFDQYVRRVALGSESLVAGLRYFNVYGPREQHKGSMASVAWHFRNQIIESGECRLFGRGAGADAGEHRRDFVYVDDVVAVNLWLYESRPGNGIVNCGSGRSQTYNELSGAVINALGKGTRKYIDFPEALEDAYQSFTQADLGALRSLGYTGEFRTVEDGVRSYFQTLGGNL